MNLVLLMVLNFSLIFLTITKWEKLFKAISSSTPIIICPEQNFWCLSEPVILLTIFISTITWLTIKILKSLNLPKFIVTLWVINLITITWIIYFIDKILLLLKIESSQINFINSTNMIFIVAILVFLNTLYSIFFIN